MAFLVGPTLQGKSPDGTITFETSFIGENEGDSDIVNFVSFSNIRFIKNEKKSDQIKVGYSVSDCPDTEEKISCLMRRECSRMDKDIKDEGISFPIAKGIKKFNLEYYDANKKEWRDDWKTTDPTFLNKLPHAVRITLIFPDPKDESEEIAFSTAVTLPLSKSAIDF